MQTGSNPAAGVIASPVATGFAPLPAAGIIAVVTLVACLFGIVTRPMGELAAFWPANALLLGLLVRNPHWATPYGWLAAILAYMAADLGTGSTVMKSALLNGANLVGVAAGFIAYQRLGPAARRLDTPLSVLQMVLVLLLAATATGLVGAVANVLLFGGSAWHGWLFWFVAELVNAIAILPVVLTAPDLTRLAHERRRARQQAAIPFKPARLLPVAALALSCLLGIFIGGPGAVAIPVPALLWCAIAYDRFQTALLALGFTGWTLLAISTGYLQLSSDAHATPTLLSIRLGVMLIAITPITTASVMAAHQDLLKQLQHIADHDHLTGALNRRAFNQRSREMLAWLAGNHTASAMLMLDIDHFKRVNDSHGHATGDAMLVQLARIVRECLRESDVFARLGGEEFAILLPACDDMNATAIAERIRQAFAQARLQTETGQSISATISIGIATAPQSAEDCSRLLAQADQALYRAKEAGRNRVVPA